MLVVDSFLVRIILSMTSLRNDFHSH